MATNSRNGPAKSRRATQTIFVVDADLVDGPPASGRWRHVQASLADEVPAPAGVAMPGGIQHLTADAAEPGHLWPRRTSSAGSTCG
jgi:hypothetical protein